ncbi:type II toxin-antitoxin system RelE/ParE family toxin [Pseudoflavitalea sp. G-6-1-2]|uniref:type II toxin-antitoxin system RelE/ParE family toxin n=1 Tax=Pseudoflavitalea sp. G-6-1-2 TaxID=2728841 RepID=UPI00146A6F22|nr:type II toxin-antitoxin system RelE/ParE family toxin [Pseudoflavitalea sp. G-6-1-2]NML23709.1 type II toxin-antitoxin system RelE/ParE family toxin [Pseudoflavitalea sp. G-6-1-2]
MHKLVLQSEAVNDMQEAFEWYEQQKEGLGFDFIDEVENSFEKIKKHPHYYTAINARYRRLKVNRFPYLVVFETEAETVIVNSVFHTSRRSPND